MAIDPNEAGAMLKDVAGAERRTREFLVYTRAGDCLIVWGVLWAVGYGLTDFTGSRTGELWIALNAFGCLPVLATAIDSARAANMRLTPVYSYRMLQNFSASNDSLGDVKHVRGPVSLCVGGGDEIIRAEQYGTLLKPARPARDGHTGPGAYGDNAEVTGA